MNLMLSKNCCLEKSLSSDVSFFEEKVDSLSVAPKLGVVIWWWLRVNVAYSQVVPCWHILPNMLVFEYCSFSPESSIIESYLFTVSFIRLVLLVLLVHVRRSFDL